MTFKFKVGDELYHPYLKTIKILDRGYSWGGELRYIIRHNQKWTGSFTANVSEMLLNQARSKV